MADIITDGKTRVSWVTTLASPAAPTEDELPGVALETFITPDGLAIELGDDEVDTSALNSTFSHARAGRGTVSIEITFKDQGRSAAPWTTFASRPTGYLVVRRNIDATTDFAENDLVEVYTCQAGDRQPVAPAANETQRFSVKFFSSSDPILNATVAAGA